MFLLVWFLGILIYDWTLLSKWVLEVQGKRVNFKNWVGSRKSVLNKNITAHNSDSHLKDRKYLENAMYNMHLPLAYI